MTLEKINYFPEISISESVKEGTKIVKTSTYIRVERKGVWYKVLVSGEYFNTDGNHDLETRDVYNFMDIFLKEVYVNMIFFEDNPDKAMDDIFKDDLQISERERLKGHTDFCHHVV